MLSIKDLTFVFGPRLLFSDVNLTLNAGNRFGLVGGNGAGKSTFLKVIAGEEEPTLGEVSTFKNSRIGWLNQDHFRYEDVSIVNAVIAGNKELWGAMCKKEEIYAQGEFDDEAGYLLGELEQVIIDNDGYNAEYIAGELLSGIGIKEEYHHQPLSVLSGGYKLRVLLAQSLFDNPDILLLDEPTNHLDIDSIYWLESYLMEKFKGVLLFISHDLLFMNNLATHILDIDYGEIRPYTGNYYSFVQQKQAVMEQKMKEHSYTEKKIATMQANVDKFRSGTRAKQAQSREKQIAKIELPDVRKSSRVAPFFNFTQLRPSGKIALKVVGLAKSYGEKKLFSKMNLNIIRGDKVIIIGPNGVGKSTLLKIILGSVSSDEGTFEWGHEAHTSYFAQDHHDLLNKPMTVVQWLTEQLTDEPTSRIRSILGQMLFGQDDAHKNILTLSGGEGARLLLAKIMAEQSNCLILDEPTNHLDIEAKDALQKALVKFPGTLIMVTHDRHFAANIASRIIAITEKGVIDFKGTYDEYLHAYGKDYFKK